MIRNIMINASLRKPRFPKTNGHVSSDQQLDWDDVLPVPKLSFSVASVLVFCLAVLCFANSHDAGFVYDDLRAIINNRDLIPETPLTAIFAHDFWGQELDEKSHKSYRPLTVMTFRWNYAWAGGLHPRGFHVVNIVLHGLVSVIFMAVFSVLMSGYQVDQEFARPVFASPRAALLCAVLFAVHPIHTESVAGVVGRADLLCALTFLLSFLLYARACLSPLTLVSYRPESFSLVSLLASMCLCVVSTFCKEQGITVIVSVFSVSSLVSYRPEFFSPVSVLASMCLCVVSTFCKEQGITAIGVCSVFDIIVVCRVDPFQWLSCKKYVFSTHCVKSKHAMSSWWKSLIKRHLILFLTSVSLLITRIRIMGSTTPIFSENENPHSFVNDTMTKIVNYNYLYAMNSWLLLNPWWLCYDWSMGCIPVITSLADCRILAVIALWAGFAALFYHCYHGHLTKDRRILITSLAVLGLPFLPASNLFFRVGFVIAERILYLSCAGFCMLVVLGARQICLHLHNTAKQYTSAGLTFLIVIFLLRSNQRCKEFSGELALYTAAVKVCPLNAKIHFNIAKVQDNNTDTATDEYRLSLTLNPRYVSAMINLAIILRQRGDALEAEELLERAVSVRNDSVDAWMNLGVVQSELKKNDSAVASFMESIRHGKKCSDCYFNLGNLYRDTGRHTNAIAAWQNATQISPTTPGAWKNYLLFLEDLGKYDHAIEVGKEALKALPRDTDLIFRLANIYILAEKYKESEDLFLAGIQIDEHSARFHHNLGVLYYRWGKYEKAKKSVTQANLLSPDDATIRSNLQLINRKVVGNRKSPHL
ncbi:protein O-mannosyl-transferase TMTC4-like [Haliotis rufescens]|uniref:protein O-mannosyl-transferase TMTC4-like n=1 Tax=Haliotis rufescens TaxID=6454 RepID=UPI00201F9DB0|nr:protein O-mannosyl-transferase TMTC4-like [Haliotis rufescens]